MNLRIVRDILLFMLFCIVHVLVLSHIRLLGHATPMLYVYFILLFPRNYPRWALLLWSFAAMSTILYIVPIFQIRLPFVPSLMALHFDEIPAMIAG